MNTEAWLDSQGVSLPQAREWVWQHLEEPALIVQVAKDFGVSNAMLGEIAGWPDSPFDRHVVQAFFWEQGVDSASLDWGRMDTQSLQVVGWVPDEWLGQAGRVVLNERADEWSNESLREQVVALANVDLAGYIRAFDPWRYPLDGGNVLDTQAAGFSQVGVQPASWLTMESLFYGTWQALMPTAGISDAVLAGVSFVQLMGVGQVPSVFDMAQPSLNLL